jgi:hypothetical protein
MQYSLLGNTGLRIGELDAATPLPPVYPNFFTDNIALDRLAAEALRRQHV